MILVILQSSGTEADIDNKSQIFVESKQFIFYFTKNSWVHIIWIRRICSILNFSISPKGATLDTEKFGSDVCPTSTMMKETKYLLSVCAISLALYNKLLSSSNGPVLAVFLFSDAFKEMTFPSAPQIPFFKI